MRGHSYQSVELALQIIAGGKYPLDGMCTHVFPLVKTDRDRAATVSFVALRAVDSLKTIFTPFLPHTSQVVHVLVGHEGYLAGPLEFREVEEDDGREHEILTGDYASWVGRWEPSDLQPGQALQEPRGQRHR